ncbi:MAG: PIN domain-containing protein [Verrucomicrobiota bacterium]
MTLGELYQWLFLRAFSDANKNRLLTYISEHIVVPYDEALAWRWAQLSAERRKAGLPMSMEDSWIAATALRHNLPLVTHNPKHFKNIPRLEVIKENREHA